jgi:hypothetical protein
LLPRQHLKVEAAFEGPHEVRCDQSAKKIVMMSPAFRIHTEVGLQGLPKTVHPTDDIGILQTIFKNKGKAGITCEGAPQRRPGPTGRTSGFKSSAKGRQRRSNAEQCSPTSCSAGR